MVLSRNAVYSALLLVVNFFCLAGFYVLLEAQFVAAVQVIVYAGAIMVLFLFVLMLLGVGNEVVVKEQMRGQRPAAVLLTLGLLVAASLFVIGVAGVLIRRNAIVVFMCIELMLNAVNLSFITFVKTNGAPDGQVLAFFVMVVAAAEVVVGLGILVAIFRKRSSTSVDDVNLLKG